MTSNGIGDEPFRVVGIGASAGGLAAIRKLLPGLVPGRNAAYLIIQHAAPDQPTQLPGLLSVATAMPVLLLDHETEIAASHIYVLAPGLGISEINGRRVVVNERARPIGAPHIIDSVFASLADSFGDRSIGIILSGTGSDGEHGLRAIRTASGLAFVQDPASADFSDMPTAAIDAGLADFVLDPAAIAIELNKHLISPLARHVRVKEDEKAEDLDLQDLLNFLRKKTGFDFQSYKESTLRRRIDRRLAVHHLDSLKAYRDLIDSSDREASLLLNDIFINVTKFFRDPVTFEAIGRAVKGLLNQKHPHESVRIWVPGCATGEEAFSIAIQIVEQAQDRLNDLQIQIFGTDIDEGAITTARKSIYLASQIDGLPAPALERYFDEVDGAFQVKNELRELVIFAQHDLMQDPPFNRLDLISCRNVMIYFKRPMQERIISLFHYALWPGGFLALGPSENVGKFSAQFKTVENGIKLFTRTAEDRITPAALGIGHRRKRRDLKPPDMLKPMSMEECANTLLVSGYGPAGVLVNQMQKVKFVRGDVSRFLGLRPGEADLSVVDMVIDALRLEVRLILKKAQHERIIIRGRSLLVKDAAGLIEVRPVAIPTTPSSDRGHFCLLLFETKEVTEGPGGGAPVDEASDLRIRELEHELVATREHLQTSIEELEASNEELQSMVEEFDSTTEELQSGNEELQTTNEELQSTNEELHTVNEELKIKSEELAIANNDLQNILNVVLSGIIVLDDKLQISRYSAASKEIFKIWPASIGKPISGLESVLDLSILSQQIKETLDSDRTLEQMIDLGDSTYLIKLIPLRNESHQTGLIITFDDITTRRRHAAESRRLAAVVHDSNDALTVHDFKGNIQAWNRIAADIYGLSETVAESHNIFEFVPDNAKDGYRALIARLKAGEDLPPVLATRMTKAGTSLRVQLTLTMLRGESNEAFAIATTERPMTDDR